MVRKSALLFCMISLLTVSLCTGCSSNEVVDDENLEIEEYSELGIELNMKNLEGKWISSSNELMILEDAKSTLFSFGYENPDFCIKGSYDLVEFNEVEEYLMKQYLLYNDEDLEDSIEDIFSLFKNLPILRITNEDAVLYGEDYSEYVSETYSLLGIQEYTGRNIIVVNLESFDEYFYRRAEDDTLPLGSFDYAKITSSDYLEGDWVSYEDTLFSFEESVLTWSLNKNSDDYYKQGSYEIGTLNDFEDIFRENFLYFETEEFELDNFLEAYSDLSVVKMSNDKAVINGNDSSEFITISHNLFSILPLSDNTAYLVNLVTGFAYTIERVE